MGRKNYSWIETWNRISNRIREDHVSTYAAQASFFLVLSVFPFLILILTCIRFLPVTDADLIRVLQYVLPSEVQEFIVSIVQELIYRSNNTLLSFSVVITIWSASKGIMTISEGLNSVYRTNESRNYFILRGLAMIHTLVVLVAMILLLALFVFGNTIYHAIMQRAQLNQAGVLHNIATLIISIRVVPGFLLLFLMFVAMYRELANHRITVKMAAPGALFSAVSWIAVSFGFSIYINYFSSYSKIYGSLTALAIAMLWIYMMMNLLLLGGEINVYLTTQYPDVFPPAKAKKHKLRSLGRRNSRHTEK